MFFIPVSVCAIVYIFNFNQELKWVDKFKQEKLRLADLLIPAQHLHNDEIKTSMLLTSCVIHEDHVTNMHALKLRMTTSSFTVNILC